MVMPCYAMVAYKIMVKGIDFQSRNLEKLKSLSVLTEEGAEGQRKF